MVVSAVYLAFLAQIIGIVSAVFCLQSQLFSAGLSAWFLWSGAMFLWLLCWNRQGYYLIFGCFVLLAMLRTFETTAPSVVLPECLQQQNFPWTLQAEVLPGIKRPLANHGGFRQQLQLQVAYGRCQQQWYSLAPLRLQVDVDEQMLLAAGDTVLLSVTQLHLPVYNKKTAAWLRQQRTFVHGYAKVLGSIVVVGSGKGLKYRLSLWRRQCSQLFERHLSKQTQSLAKAMLLGDSSGMTAMQRKTWGMVGVAHLLAVSGLHVGCVALLLQRLLALLLAIIPGALSSLYYLPLQCLGSLGFIWLYALLVGEQASVLRATCMMTLLLLAKCSLKPYTARRGWVLSGMLLLAIEPWFLFDVGFLLSFAAVWALLFLTPQGCELWGDGSLTKEAWQQNIHRLEQQDLLLRLWRSVCHLLTSSLSTSFVTAPLTAYFFQQVSLIGIVCNIILIPLMLRCLAPLLLLSLLSLSALSFFEKDSLSALVGFFSLLPNVLDSILQRLDAGIEVVALWPIAALWVPVLSFWQAVAYGWLALGLWFYYRDRLLAKSYALSWVKLSFSLMLAWGCYRYAIFLDYRQQQPFEVWALDVGHGDSLLLRFPEKAVMLIDGGGALKEGDVDPGRFVVQEVLKAQGIKVIDYLVLSHDDNDHLLGLLAIAQTFQINHFWYPQQASEALQRSGLADALQKRHCQLHASDTLPSQQSIQGVDVQIFDGNHRWRGNNSSLLMAMTYGENNILLTGDIHQAREKALLQQFQAVDILKVAHHGSDSSSSHAFLQRIQPQHAIVSVGRNPYGLPKEQVIERLTQHGAKVWRTDHCGHIICRSDGKIWDVAGMLKTCQATTAPIGE